MPLHGRALVIVEEGRLKDAISRANAIDALDQLSGDVAQYLVLRVAGWLEQSAYELARARCRRHVSGPVLSFSLSHLERTTNPWCEQLVILVGRFDAGWQSTLDAFLAGERKDAINSLMGLRTRIAHGEASTARTSVARVAGYYQSCSEVVELLCDLLDPPVPQEYVAVPA